MLPVLLASLVLAVPSHGCHKRFTYQMGRRAIAAVYHERSLVTKRQTLMVQRIIRCQWKDSHKPALRRRWATARRARRERRSLTGFVVSGRVSEFGPPLSGIGRTADGTNDGRPCIAIRDDSTLGRMFRVTVLGHSADLVHCDWGPAAFTGRAIDITGAGWDAMGLSGSDPATDAFGTAVMLR